MQCYFCDVSDPNETHFDPEIHHICMICGVKLWELAQKELEFDLREQIVLITTRNFNEAVNLKRIVTLSTGYKIDIENIDGLEHLFNAIIGEVLIRLKNTEEFSERGFGVVYDVCICELHFVAGQLYHIGSSLDIQKLLDEFGVQWDRIAGKLNGGKID